MSAQPSPATSTTAIRQWVLLSGVTVAVAVAIGIGLEQGVETWRAGTVGPVVGGAAIGFVAITAIGWRAIVGARHTDGDEPITLATWVTVGRGGTVVALAGFVLIEPPVGQAAWIPGVLFAVAAGLDAIDGKVARATDSVSELGRRLDVEMDSITVLFGAVLAVRYGAVPAAFLVVGLARYAFVVGIHYRRWRHRAVYELDPRPARRVLGGLAMGAICLALVPVPGTAVSRFVAALVLVPFLLNFVRDWLVVSGRHPTVAPD